MSVESIRSLKDIAASIITLAVQNKSWPTLTYIVTVNFAGSCESAEFFKFIGCYILDLFPIEENTFFRIYRGPFSVPSIHLPSIYLIYFHLMFYLLFSRIAR